jgi:hypothetical protein
VRASLDALDRKETEGHTYRRITWFALDDTGREHAVVTYEVAAEHREPFVEPPEPYLQIVRRLCRARHRPRRPRRRRPQRTVPGSIRQLFVYGTLMRGGTPSGAGAP